MENLSNAIDKKSDASESRLMPFAVAGLVCFAAAFIIGAGGWYFFGTNHRLSPEKSTITVAPDNQNSAVENSNSTATAAPTVEQKKAPAGEIAVSGGVVELGGGETDLPARRISVALFSIGETEVTNAQYAEFIQETNHPPPAAWKNNKFPGGTAEEPVANVSWADANAYCEWLSQKLGATARLPNEAEWELAARGATNHKFPWGNDWNDEAVESAKTNRRVRPVKSFPAGRSPLGAYDMVGNVWEWTGDLFTDENSAPVLFEGAKQRVIKGGSAYDDRKLLSIASRLPRPENKPSAFLGFRYVIIRQ